MGPYFPFQSSPLPYSYVALMPHCDANTLYYHHDDYYANGIYALNHLVVNHRLTALSLPQLITRDISLPAAQLNRLKNAAGMVYNHQLYFDGISCTSGQPPFNRLTETIITTYGSIDAFLKLLTEAAEGLIGAGWVWLVAEGDKGIHIATTRNNDVVSLEAVTPILVLDMWEHAYLSMDHFDRAAYVSAWFSLVNWAEAEQRYIAAVNAAAERRQSAGAG